MGMSISADTILEFPTSTMFWCRPEVLKPILGLNLSPEGFEPEAAQEDGTLAHAIERCFNYLTEHAGYRAHRVAHVGHAVRGVRRDDKAAAARFCPHISNARTPPDRQHRPHFPLLPK